MNKKELIEALETERRILYNELFVNINRSGLHSRHVRKLERYKNINKELCRLSLKWRIKTILRRIFKHGKN